jgi:hypothetical protein
MGQLEQVSPLSQVPLPHVEHVPQSSAQVWQVSPSSHFPSPQVGGGEPSGVMTSSPGPSRPPSALPMS